MKDSVWGLRGRIVPAQARPDKWPVKLPPSRHAMQEQGVILLLARRLLHALPHLGQLWSAKLGT